MYINCSRERDLLKKCLRNWSLDFWMIFLKHFWSRSRSWNPFMYIVFTCNCFSWSSRWLHVKMMYITWFYERDLFKNVAKRWLKISSLQAFWSIFWADPVRETDLCTSFLHANVLRHTKWLHVEMSYIDRFHERDLLKNVLKSVCPDVSMIFCNILVADPARETNYVHYFDMQSSKFLK